MACEKLSFWVWRLLKMPTRKVSIQQNLLKIAFGHFHNCQRFFSLRNRNSSGSVHPIDNEDFLTCLTETCPKMG